MNKASPYQDLEYKENKPVVNILFETSFTKEIRIAMKSGMEMKEHQSPFSIVIQIVEGTIEFGVDETTHMLEKGNLIALEGGGWSSSQFDSQRRQYCTPDADKIR